MIKQVTLWTFLNLFWAKPLLYCRNQQCDPRSKPWPYRPRGVLRISSDGDDRMRVKIKTPRKALGLPTKPTHFWTIKLTRKKCHAEFPSRKDFQKELNDIARKRKINWKLNVCVYGSYTRAVPRIFRLFWVPPKDPFVNQATQKNTCQIFLPQKMLRSSPSLGIRSTQTGRTGLFKITQPPQNLKYVSYFDNQNENIVSNNVRKIGSTFSS